MECPKCHKKISDKMPTCPYCGKIISAAGLNYTSDTYATKTAPQTTRKTQLNFSGNNTVVKKNSPQFSDDSSKAQVQDSEAYDSPSFENPVNVEDISITQQNSGNEKKTGLSIDQSTVDETVQDDSVAAAMQRKIEAANKYSYDDYESVSTDSEGTFRSQEDVHQNHEERESNDDSNIQDDIDAPEEANTKKSLTSLLFKKKKNKDEKKSASWRKKKSDNEVSEDQDTDDEGIDENTDKTVSEYSNEEKFDPNADGYYNDVLPVIAQEINKLPVENVLRIVFTVIFVIGIALLFMFT